jgi:peptidoglycan/LPS O-acetylase OafA/YrhL
MWIGVPIFFVISGYCIAATADSSRRKSIGYVPYAIRRIRRIFPPYLICLAVTAALVAAAEVARPGSITVTGWMHRPWWFSASQWFGNVTLTELWRYHLLGGPKGLFLGHAWTLCYEEQFYAVMGLLLFVARHRFFLATAVVTLACPVIAFVCRLRGIPIDGFFFDGGWSLFACGVLVYYALNYTSRMGRVAAAVALVVALTYAAWEPSLLLESTKKYQQELFVAAGFALVILLSRTADDWLTSRVWLRPLFACGTRCYSLYLVHFPVAVFLNAGARQLGIDPTGLTPLVTIPVGIIASVAVAWLFFWTVEQRFLNSSNSRQRPGHSISVSSETKIPETGKPRPSPQIGPPLVETLPMIPRG